MENIKKFNDFLKEGIMDLFNSKKDIKVTADDLNKNTKNLNALLSSKLKEEAEDKFDSVCSKIDSLLYNSKDNIDKKYIKIKMSVFFTKSSKGRNPNLVDMVEDEYKSRGFRISTTIDGRNGDVNDYMTIRW